MSNVCAVACAGRCVVSATGDGASMEEHWHSTLDELRQKLSAESFLTWLEPIRFDSFDGTRVKVRAHQSFLHRLDRSHYLELMLEGLRARGVRTTSSTSSGKRTLHLKRTEQPGAGNPAHLVDAAARFEPPTSPSSPPSATNLNPKYRSRISSSVEPISSRMPQPSRRLRARARATNPSSSTVASVSARRTS